MDKDCRLGEVPDGKYYASPEYLKGCRECTGLSILGLVSLSEGRQLWCGSRLSDGKPSRITVTLASPPFRGVLCPTVLTGGNS